jgi:hypothetical protein
MALAEIDAICRRCSTQFRAQPKRTFLGFQKLQCPKCTQEVLYPLTSGYRVTYWVFLALMVVIFVANLSEGVITFPGLIGIGVIVGLIRDGQIRREVATAIAMTARPAP